MNDYDIDYENFEIINVIGETDKHLTVECQCPECHNFMQLDADYFEQIESLGLKREITCPYCDEHLKEEDITFFDAGIFLDASPLEGPFECSTCGGFMSLDIDELLAIFNCPYCQNPCTT